MDYIHYNPVKHGWTNAPRDWEWSSFQQCVQKGWYASDWGTQQAPTLPKWIGNKGGNPSNAERCFRGALGLTSGFICI
ncbi:hypothetical protein HORIV_22630 [Vreelandella olivaria]|uniref:Uncharacterized protein n=1 Tax=Vreelandella olivaria TaxID=390919 RepID=A0ABN5WSG4_9GAMM|nr:hypothetical protein HORIV_22630 [Halomonas olivaria]